VLLLPLLRKSIRGNGQHHLPGAPVSVAAQPGAPRDYPVDRPGDRRTAARIYNALLQQSAPSGKSAC